MPHIDSFLLLVIIEKLNRIKFLNWIRGCFVWTGCYCNRATTMTIFPQGPVRLEIKVVKQNKSLVLEAREATLLHLFIMYGKAAGAKMLARNMISGNFSELALPVEEEGKYRIKAEK